MMPNLRRASRFAYVYVRDSVRFVSAGISPEGRICRGRAAGSARDVPCTRSMRPTA